MDDRELLERAAKAAGIELAPTGYVWDDESAEMVLWDPLFDDGDALRLAVKLQMRLDVLRAVSDVSFGADGYVYEDHGADPYAATRRAIVRAAAAMGEE